MVYERNDTDEMVMLDYYTKDSTGEVIREYGEVSTHDIQEMEGYDLPVHKSLWK